MVEIVVYFSGSYDRNDSFYVSKELTKEAITEEVNKRYGKEGWYSYDIWDE
jgi:hypothetical protein